MDQRETTGDDATVPLGPRIPIVRGDLRGWLEQVANDALAGAVRSPADPSPRSRARAGEAAGPVVPPPRRAPTTAERVARWLDTESQPFRDRGVTLSDVVQRVTADGLGPVNVAAVRRTIAAHGWRKGEGTCAPRGRARWFGSGAALRAGSPRTGAT